MFIRQQKLLLDCEMRPASDWQNWKTEQDIQFSNSNKASFCLALIDTRESLLLIVSDSEEALPTCWGQLTWDNVQTVAPAKQHATITCGIFSRCWSTIAKTSSYLLWHVSSTVPRSRCYSMFTAPLLWTYTGQHPLSTKLARFSGKFSLICYLYY
jgi:hypothetical protein